jgi:ubiquinone/menaquinone biosynthesis C-methylase UbiE
MATEDHFRRYQSKNAAENYEQLFVPLISAPLAGALLEYAALRPGERVLDVACGTGEVARRARDRVGPEGRVVGADGHPGMIAVARAVTPAGIEWHEAGAAAMPFGEGAFDVVLCQLGLQFMGDKVSALREMRRVLVPGGRLLVSVVGPTPPLFRAMAESFERHVGEASGKFVHVVFSFHDPDAIRRVADEAGLREVEVHSHTTTLSLPPAAEFLWQYVHSTPLAPHFAKLADERRAALERDVVAAWRPFAAGDGLEMPLDVHTLIARP